jgi:hypothetical protein
LHDSTADFWLLSGGFQLGVQKLLLRRDRNPMQLRGAGENVPENPWFWNIHPFPITNGHFNGG